MQINFLPNFHFCGGSKAKRNIEITFSPTVDRTVQKVPGKGQISLQGVVQESTYDVAA